MTKAIGSSAAITVKVARIVELPTSSTALGTILLSGTELHRPAPVDVLDHHDGVVDQDPDREDEREERHTVQSEPPNHEAKSVTGERQQHRDADDERFAPPERREHQRDHRQR